MSAVMRPSSADVRCRSYFCESVRKSRTSAAVSILHVSGAPVRAIGRPAFSLLAAAEPATAAPCDPVCPGTVPGQPFIGIDKASR